MEQGDLVLADKVAESSFTRLHDRNPDWSTRFLLLHGEILLRQGHSREAVAILDQPLPASLANDDVAVRRLIYAAIGYYHLQEYARTKQLLDNARRLSIDKSPQIRSEVALIQGTVAAFQNEFDSARTDYRRALDLAREGHEEYLQSNALGGLGLAEMRQEHYDAAIDWFDSSLQLARSLRNQPLEAVTLGNLGWCYYKLGDLDRSADFLSAAAIRFEKLRILGQLQIWLDDLGVVNYARGEYGQAEAYFQKSLVAARATQNQVAIATALNDLAAISIQNKDISAAEKYVSEARVLYENAANNAGILECFEHAGRIATEQGNYEKAETNFLAVVTRTRDPVLRWTAESDLAVLYEFENRHTDADREFQKGLATIDQARSSLSVEEHRLSFLTSASRFYNSYINFLVEHGGINDALRIVEHSRARTLAEGLGLKPVSLNAKLAPESISHETRAVILEYWLKPQQSYLWAITPSKVQLYKLPADIEINGAIQDYRKALLGPRDPLETGNQTGRKLYDMLVAPAEKLIRPGARVVVIADGALNNLNFETLIAPAPKPHYWIEDVVLSDASSLALLSGSRRPHPSHSRKLLLVGDPVAASSEYPRLPQAAAEMTEVEQHFPAKARVVLEGAQATPQAYLASDTSQFSYVHFVAHGTASRTTPLESAVVLSPQGDSYKLYARDIITKPLHADLVTISTCYGAGSRAYTGEGLVGLSWAFLRAGAHNTIAALWEVSDASTAELMDHLYAGIDNGQDPAVALRSAKLAMAHSDGVYRRPFYWAPFQLYEGSSGVGPKIPPRTPSGDD